METPKCYQGYSIGDIVEVVSFPSNRRQEGSIGEIIDLHLVDDWPFVVRFTIKNTQICSQNVYQARHIIKLSLKEKINELFI